MITIEINAATVAEAVAEMNKGRKNNPETWITFRVVVNGLKYAFKTFNTLTQIFQSDSFRASGLYGLNVGEWKKEAEKFLSA